MFNPLRYILLLALSTFIALGAFSQSAMPDFVYIGSTKHYNVDPTPGSVYTWKINGVTQPGITTNAIDLTWNVPGKYTLSVQELTKDGCLGPVQAGEVYVYQVTIPPPIEECVENTRSARYDIVTKTVIVDQPDYYVFKPGDTRLDLSPANFAGSFPLSCPVEIHWQIDFSPEINKPPVTGTGQPSTITEQINLPGDGTNTKELVHTITYWIKDCHGYTSYTNSQIITIRPRPKIL